MKTLTIENLNDSDLQLFISLANRLKIKTRVLETDETALTDCINPASGEFYTVGQLQEVIRQAEQEKSGMGKDEFVNHLQQWQKKLTA